MKHVDIITIFPEYFEPLKLSLIGKAIERDLVHVNIVQLRNFAPDPHHNIDDTPYGGGAGMVMKPDILSAAIDSVLQENSTIIFTSPAGVTFNQQLAHKFHSADFEHLIFVCGRFEGYDARLIDYYRTVLSEQQVLEVSIGDYVLNGGEVATLVMLEAIIRLIPGVVGNPHSLVQESHELTQNGDTLLEYPNYTRPANFKGLTVPEVLMSGNHKEIDNWRLNQAKLRTDAMQSAQSSQK